MLTLNKKERNPKNKSTFSSYYYANPEDNVHIALTPYMCCRSLYSTIQILVGALSYNPYLAFCFKSICTPIGSEVDWIDSDSMRLTVSCLQT